MSSKIKGTTANNPSLPTNWSKREKFKLLKALKKYGHANIAKISNIIATKSQEDVEIMINKLMIESRAIKKDAQPLLNDWLECESIKNTRSKKSLIRRALLFIHLFENHLTSADGTYNYRAIYYFLYKLFCGCQAPELSKDNQILLYELLSEVTKQTVSVPQKDITITLEKLLDQKANIRTYPAKKKS